MPIDNEKDVEEVPEEITDGLEICLVSSMEEVLQETFAKRINTKKRSK